MSDPRSAARPEPGSWDDPHFRRQLALGKILGAAIIIVPMGFFLFIRVMSRSRGDGRFALGVAGMIAIGVLVAVIINARKPLDRNGD